MSESADRRRTRRRWLTLAELVAIAGVVIAGLSLWSGWTERRADQDERRTEKLQAARTKGTLLFEGTPEHGGAALKLADAAHRVQSITVQFPRALNLPAREALVEPRIEAEWIAAPLLALTEHGQDVREGKLPVLITAEWWEADTHRSSRALYDLVWRTHGRLLRGRVLTLEGVILRQQGGDQARIDGLWAREKPGK